MNEEKQLEEAFMDAYRNWRHASTRFKLYGIKRAGIEAIRTLDDIARLVPRLVAQLEGNLANVKKQQNVELLDKLLNLKKD
jgi:hypothetical protein